MLAYMVGVALLLLLFDIHITLDTLSYNPYIGPAVAVLHGAVPLRDVFSQYGLNYLVFSALLALVDGAMFVATFVVAVLNIVYYLALFGIALSPPPPRFVPFRWIVRSI